MSYLLLKVLIWFQTCFKDFFNNCDIDYKMVFKQVVASFKWANCYMHIRLKVTM